MSLRDFDLVADEEGNFYRVKGVLSAIRENCFRSEKLLWDGAQSRRPGPEGPDLPPSAVSGQSVKKDIGQEVPPVKTRRGRDE